MGKLMGRPNIITRWKRAAQRSESEKNVSKKKRHRYNVAGFECGERGP